MIRALAALHTELRPDPPRPRSVTAAVDAHPNAAWSSDQILWLIEEIERLGPGWMDCPRDRVLAAAWVWGALRSRIRSIEHQKNQERFRQKWDLKRYARSEAATLAVPVGWQMWQKTALVAWDLGVERGWIQPYQSGPQAPDAPFAWPKHSPLLRDLGIGRVKIPLVGAPEWLDLVEWLGAYGTPELSADIIGMKAGFMEDSAMPDMRGVGLLLVAILLGDLPELPGSRDVAARPLPVRS